MSERYVNVTLVTDSEWKWSSFLDQVSFHWTHFLEYLPPIHHHFIHHDEIINSISAHTSYTALYCYILHTACPTYRLIDAVLSSGLYINVSATLDQARLACKETHINSEAGVFWTESTTTITFLIWSQPCKKKKKIWPVSPIYDIGSCWWADVKYCPGLLFWKFTGCRRTAFYQCSVSAII